MRLRASARCEFAHFILRMLDDTFSLDKVLSLVLLVEIKLVA